MRSTRQHTADLARARSRGAKTKHTIAEGLASGLRSERGARKCKSHESSRPIDASTQKPKKIQKLPHRRV